MENKKDSNPISFRDDEIDWEELSGIGILRDEIEAAGELGTLMNGGKTKVLPLSLVLMGVDVVMDATLQLIRKNDDVLIEIVGVKPTADKR